MSLSGRSRAQWMSREHSTMGKETLPLPHLEGLGCAASQPRNTGKSGKISQGNQSWKAGGRGGAGVQLPASISQHPRAGQGWRQLTLPKLGSGQGGIHGPTDPIEPHGAGGPQDRGTWHQAPSCDKKSSPPMSGPKELQGREKDCTGIPKSSGSPWKWG